MKIAIWIIAVCEVIRIAENAMLLISSAKTQEKMDKAYDSISKSADDLDLLDEETFKRYMGITYSATESDEDVV